MAFHLWTIREVYSNADGSVQFIELFTTGPDETQVGGETISSTGAPNYVVPDDLSSGTSNKSLLFATQGFADLGLVTPDFIIPDGFLSTSGGTLNVFGVDSLNLSSLPTNGTSSLDGNGATGTNSPTNFDGDSGSIPGNPIVGTAAAETLNGTSARDFMVGLGANDRLTGRGGNDTVNGGSGNDILTGSAGNDVMIGGTGKDTASYQSSTSGITLNLAVTGPQATGGAGSDTLSSIERATGSGYVDRLTGNNASNLLNGLGDGDTLTGRGGNDTLIGGPGTDRFVFNTALNATTNVDRITDFSPADDIIRLDQTFFTGLATGPLPLTAFPNGPAVEKDDRILYDLTVGRLYFDADGTGDASSQILFAILVGAPSISANDFFVVA